MLRWLQPKHVRLVNELLEPFGEKAQAKFLAEARKRGDDWMTTQFRSRAAREQAIAKELVAVGEPALRELVSRLGLDEPRNGVLAKALRAFGEVGSRQVTHLAEEADLPLRLALLKALWEFEGDAAGAVPWLLRQLEDATDEIRSRAVQALGRIGPAASAASSRLIVVAGEDVPEVRRRAMWALTRIDADPALTKEVFLDALCSGDPEVTGSGIGGLASLDFDPQPYRAAIVSALSPGKMFFSDAFKMLRRCDGFTASELEAMFNLGLTAEGFWLAHSGSHLVALLWEKTGEERWVFPLIDRMLVQGKLETACHAACGLGPAGAPYAPRFLDLVESQPDYWDFAWAAVDALGMMGPAAREFLPRIERLRSHPSGLVRARTDIAVRRINGEVVAERDLEE